MPKRRSSSSVSGYRGPPWSQTQQGLQSMLSPRRVPRPLTNIDMDHVDNFSYDPQYLEEFKLPNGLDGRLPDQLRREVHNWQKAGAALYTAIDRTKDSGVRAIEYAYPDATTHSPAWPLSRRPSAQASEGASATSSTTGLASPPAISPESLQPLDTLASGTLSKQTGLSDTSMGMETPPFSPIDSGANASPVTGPTATLPKSKPGVPDLAKLNTQLTPYTTLNSDSASTSATPNSATTANRPPFNDKSWEYFQGKFENELRDTKIALQRFTGYAKKIEVEKMELESDFTPEIVLVMTEFKEWWKMTGPEVSKIAHEVDCIVSPTLEELDRRAGYRGAGGSVSGSVRGKGAAATEASDGGEQRASSEQ
ncbi:hypothetical protein KC343_g7861 [Hortaea werneckii]|uniref:Uncharacterized protein n=1 Tax=Hortaea werneckii TaxID=91943 RepID=A0A3M7EV74_HORWE|nr:hypothetical protein KC323_g9001 [Hortaea werneckii]KAI7564675.1 hypothetical protein KC317_g6893 [Hortaea werneckii]KAI7617402.1 hypothetical protein KC346_g5501 [Hortaea werneckii]KAI7621836.1 hypothetical protein KC343_g7861 [Hortaea werneckii]KAI7670993.1 hypothetical protein KC319_g5703 [Hortaea werneckii]